VYLSSYISPRTLRMARIASDSGYQVVVGAWDREGEKSVQSNEKGIAFTMMRLKSPYGVRSILLAPVWFAFAFLRSLFGGFSVIQARNLDCLIPTLLASKITGSKVVYDLADFYADSYAPTATLGALSRYIELSFLRRADALILVSEGQLLQIGRYNLPKKRMIFYNVPMNQPEIAGPSPKKAVTSEKITLFYGGTMKRDRYEALRNVMKAIQGLPVQVLIAGYGLDARLFDQLPKMGDARLLGKLTHTEILEYTHRADAILLPYFSDNSNYSIALANKFFDALATGTIVLAPHQTLMGEIAEREGIGLLTNYHDVRELRSCVETLIKMGESERTLMSSKGRTLFRTRFDPEGIRREYLQIIDSMC
jgi:glycosyltransferase involved in cell wall biosynthesis